MNSGMRVDSGNGHAVVMIEGDLDMAAAPTLRPLIRGVIDGDTTRLVIDLSECTLIDSAGLGLLLGALRRARRAGGTVELVVPFDQQRRIFESCDLDRVFALHPTVDAAAQSLGPAAEGKS